MNNKKYLLSLLTIIIVAIQSVVFVSCNKDDEEEKDNIVSPLVGTWEKTEMIGGNWITTTLILNADGTYSETSRNDYEITNSEKGKYSYNETSRILVLIPTSGRSWTYTVADVSDISLVLIFSDFSGSITYTRKN